MSFFVLASSSLTDDVLMFLVILAGLLLASFLGHSGGRQRDCDGSGTVLGVVLCLSGLLTGCAFFISVVGFSAREKAETHEIQAVGRAWQYAGLLTPGDRDRSREILQIYLSERIHFFQEKNHAGLRAWGTLARNREGQLWQLAEREALLPTGSNALAVLNACSGLGDSMTQTRSVWRRQLPDAAWWVLILFALSLCYLTGCRCCGKNKSWRVLLFVPVLMSLALFVIAETDLPGQGIIHVTTDGLESLAEALRMETL